MLIVALAFLLGAATVRVWDFRVPEAGRARYQAVFLANGQTFFGRYTDRIGPYVRLDDAYYIQSTPSTEPDRPADQRLVRRGVEVHAPLHTMYIPKGSILFVEDLRPESPIGAFMERDGR